MANTVYKHRPEADAVEAVDVPAFTAAPNTEARLRRIAQGLEFLRTQYNALLAGRENFNLDINQERIKK